MASGYRGNYIGGLMQGQRKDYYSDTDPFTQDSDGGYSGEQPTDDGSGGKVDPYTETGSQSAGNSTEPPKVEFPDPTKPTTDTAATGANTTNYDTDGYPKPGYTPSNYGSAPAGWDQTKWADPNHQTPKYVVGRILVANGDMKDPNNRSKAIADIQKAYPGAQFNGKDRISIDGGKTWVDIFGGAGAGLYTPAWMPDEGSTGGKTIDGLTNPAEGMPNLPQAASDQTTQAAYSSLLSQYLRRKNGNQQPKSSF